jgi:hypothetical protein
MASDSKSAFLVELSNRFGKLRKFGESLSLYKIEGTDIRIYIRYSRTYGGVRTWYGLREIDLHQLEGYPSLICFLWAGQDEPLMIPFSEYEDVFQSTTPAEDGQYKVQVILQEDGTELYIARAGRFNVEGYFGWYQIEKLIHKTGVDDVPDLSHSQVQTLLGSIGTTKTYDIWIPPLDRSKLDWSLVPQFICREVLPYGFGSIEGILNEVDVIWIQRGSNKLQALFEVEHSTPVYSGLLRFNDIHLVAPTLRPRYSVVANEERRSLFLRQLNRPTFQTSGLSEICTFLEYLDVYNWHKRIEK